MGKFYEQRRKKLKGATLYQHLPATSEGIKQEERRAYQRLMLVFVVVIAFAAATYLWGISAVNFISSFWLNFSNNPAVSNNQDNGLIFPPRIDSLPTAINDLTQFRMGGWAPAGADVLIYINQNQTQEVLADASGRFDAGDLNLKEGENEIYAVAQAQNQKSQPSNKQTVIFDKSKPELTLNEPAENTNIVDSANKWLTVSGNSEERVQVFINDHQAIVDAQGNFKYQYPLEAGENKLKIVAKDEAGNETVVERVVNFEPPISPSPGG